MTPPQLTEIEALELLAQQYGLTGQLSTLPGERDRNFQFCLASGEKNSFKVVSADIPLESLKVEIRASKLDLRGWRGSQKGWGPRKSVQEAPGISGSWR